MGRLELVLPTKQHEAEALEYVREHLAAGEEHLNGASMLEQMDTYNAWLLHLEEKSDTATVRESWVPSTTLFAVDTATEKIVGVIDIRHYLNDFLRGYGGHIGYGIRPSARCKGYATEMLGLALDHCKVMGIDKVMLSCDKNNVASAKTIINNNGILEKEYLHADGRMVQIYWINL